jgi:hypothetical protein
MRTMTTGSYLVLQITPAMNTRRLPRFSRSLRYIRLFIDPTMIDGTIHHTKKTLPRFSNYIKTFVDLTISRNAT